MMARRTQTLSDYIAHIIEAIDRGQQYTQGIVEEDFKANQRIGNNRGSSEISG